MTHHEHTAADDTAQFEMLDLDAEVMHDDLAELTAELAGLVDPPVRRIIDLGSGTGAGTFVLLERFEQAAVLAVDTAEPVLAHLAGKAAARGVSDRVRTERADLDAEFPALGEPVDLVWASASLHHLADPARVLGEVFAALRPGGVLAVAELDSFPRFLPDDLGFGRPGLEERCRDLLARKRAEHLPHISADWAEPVAGAGFTAVAHRTVDVDLPAPLPAVARRYAEVTLRRMRPFLDASLDEADVAALGELLDSDGPGALRNRDDLTVRATRTFLAARRP
ncbi:class I SAM-dependent methyltransferase [Saccharopolyspora gregorii]|uniref:Class I SAM-dependent methyltransferase n=1 Tax=Saccharopolyspora gregorii TaxID=33914 RepID=A0ABP6S2I0_9PSEU